MPLINSQELAERLNKKNTILLDGSWYLPTQKRNAYSEYQERRIPGARFFDIDHISDPNSRFPHTIPGAERFESEVEKLGISSDSNVVVYDGSGIFSAARGLVDVSSIWP